MAFGALDPIADRDVLGVDRAVIRAFQEGRADHSGIARFIEAWNQSAWTDLLDVVRSLLTRMEP